MYRRVFERLVIRSVISPATSAAAATAVGACCTVALGATVRTDAEGTEATSEVVDDGAVAAERQAASSTTAALQLRDRVIDPE